MQISYKLSSSTRKGNIEIEVYRDGKILLKNISVGQLSQDEIKNEVKHRVAEYLIKEKARLDVGKQFTLTNADIDDINNRINR